MPDIGAIMRNKMHSITCNKEKNAVQSNGSEDNLASNTKSNWSLLINAPQYTIANPFQTAQPIHPFSEILEQYPVLLFSNNQVLIPAKPAIDKDKNKSYCKQNNGWLEYEPTESISFFTNRFFERQDLLKRFTTSSQSAQESASKRGASNPIRGIFASAKEQFLAKVCDKYLHLNDAAQAHTTTQASETKAIEEAKIITDNARRLKESYAQWWTQLLDEKYQLPQFLNLRNIWRNIPLSGQRALTKDGLQSIHPITFPTVAQLQLREQYAYFTSSIANDILLNEQDAQLANLAHAITGKYKQIYPTSLNKAITDNKWYKNDERAIQFRHNATHATMYTIVRPFQIQTQTRTFEFDETILETQLALSDNNVTILKFPKINNPPYPHFFVHSNGDICYATQLRWNEIGVQKERPYSITDPTIPGKIARVLQEGENNLTQGYVPGCTFIIKPEQLIYKVKSTENGFSAEQTALKDNLRARGLI